MTGRKIYQSSKSDELNLTTLSFYDESHVQVHFFYIRKVYIWFFFLQENVKQWAQKKKKQSQTLILFNSPKRFKIPVTPITHLSQPNISIHLAWVFISTWLMFLSRAVRVDLWSCTSQITSWTWFSGVTIWVLLLHVCTVFFSDVEIRLLFLQTRVWGASCYTSA